MPIGRLMDLKDLKELRDLAYVKAMTHSMERDDVLGYIGKDLPLDIIYSFGLYAIPVESDDRNILEFGDGRMTCGGAYGTYLYLKLDKCPLMHSSKLIIIEDMCPVLKGLMLSLDNPKVKVYRDEESLINIIEETYQVKYDKNNRIRAGVLLEEGERLAKELPWEYGFYSLFLESLEERNNFLCRK